MSSLLEAAKAFVEQLRYVLDGPAYLRVWEIAQLHLGPYEGPQYTNELQALRAAIALAEAEEPYGWLLQDVDVRGNPIGDESSVFWKTKDEAMDAAVRCPPPAGGKARLIPIYRRPAPAGPATNAEPISSEEEELIAEVVSGALAQHEVRRFDGLQLAEDCAELIAFRAGKENAER